MLASSQRKKTRWARARSRQRDSREQPLGTAVAVILIQVIKVTVEDTVPAGGAG